MKICVINTGGTISCVGTPLAPMSAAEFKSAAEDLLLPALTAALPDISLVFETGLRFSKDGPGTLDSTDLTPRDWCIMADYVLAHYGEYDGFLILHGTDSLDFSGSALPFMLNVFDGHGRGVALLSKPVILTGSQLPMFRKTGDGLVLNAGSDAYANFAGALECMPRHIPEVSAFFAGRLFRGNRVLKVNTMRFDAFDSPHLPPLAETGTELTPGAPALPMPEDTVSLDHGPALELARQQMAAIGKAIDSVPVAQIDAFPGYASPGGPAFLARVIDGMAAAGARALVLQSYGEGNFPSGAPGNSEQGANYIALKKAIESGVLVVDSTRVIAGSVGAFHYAAGAWIAEIGAVSARDMTPMAAFAKTMVLMAAAGCHGWNAEVIKRLLGLPLCGELTEG